MQNGNVVTIQAVAAVPASTQHLNQAAGVVVAGAPPRARLQTPESLLARAPLPMLDLPMAPAAPHAAPATWQAMAQPAGPCGVHPGVLLVRHPLQPPRHPVGHQAAKQHATATQAAAAQVMVMAAEPAATGAHPSVTGIGSLDGVQPSWSTAKVSEHQDVSRLWLARTRPVYRQCRMKVQCNALLEAPWPD